jgi:phenylalanyl-tRNA synthetase beta chain
MKASVRWLRELCPLLTDDASAIAARFTAAGLEVEGTTAFGLGAEACVIVSVVSTRPHPSRSGLRLVTVDRGGAQQEVVCGAPNVPEPGGLVVLAPLGTHLPAKGMTIERRTIAGVASEGMLCSEAELGLGDDESGILVLPAGTATAGAPLVKVLPGARDTILEIGLTPNRPDGLGHVGLAREAAALFEVPFLPPVPEPPARVRDEDLSAYIAVSIEDGERCPHFGAAVMLDARVAPSPLEVRWRLASLGVRSISNLVDVTNLVMLEGGHPMHAYDLDKVRGRKIVVRRATEGEGLTTLDGIARVLSTDDLVICDGEGPVGLGGVMGGGNSEISATTTRVLLECAYFDPRGVRRSARRHGLHTEASHRFERGVDWGDTAWVIARAASLVASLSGAEAVREQRVFEAQALSHRTVTLRHDRVHASLGVAVPHGDTLATLDRLGFARRASQPGMDVWEVPSFRPDVSREIDLVEEVARVRGFDAIPATLPAICATRDAGPREGLARRARDAGVALGLSEALTLAFASPRDLEAVSAPPPVVTLQNPMGERGNVMRTSLLPGLLHALAHARRHGERDARLFTVGTVFLASHPAKADVATDERLSFTALLAGDRPAWLHRPEGVDVWDAKGVAAGLVERLLRKTATVRRAEGDERPAHLHPRGAASIEVDGRRVGVLGPVHPDVLDAFDLDGGVLVVELDLQALDTAGAQPARFVAIPRFPASTRDLAVVVKDGVPAGDVELAVRDAAGDLGEHVALFDRFVGGSVPAGHASLALHVVYRAADRTLTDVEVDQRHAHVVAEVARRFGAQLRS